MPEQRLARTRNAYSADPMNIYRKAGFGPVEASERAKGQCATFQDYARAGYDCGCGASVQSDCPYHLKNPHAARWNDIERGEH
jgi:hypothetical protein